MNPFIYISCDHLDRTRRLEYNLRQLLHDDRLRYLSFGHGDATPKTADWDPSDYGLVIFILSLSGYQRQDFDDYRIQRELQKVDAELKHGDRDTPSTLMFIQNGVEQIPRYTEVNISDTFSDVRVLSHILDLGRSWIEYSDDAQLESLLRGEIIYFQSLTKLVAD